MDQGYVKIWRKSLNSGLMKNANLWTFWSWCLLSATWRSHRTFVGYQVVDLEPGQFVFTRRTASEELEMSEKTIRTCRDTLEKLGIISVRGASKFSVITIVNWDVYQDPEAGYGPTNGQQGANKGPGKGQQAANKGPALIIETNKGNKERIYPSSDDDLATDAEGEGGEKGEEENLLVNSGELTDPETVDEKEKENYPKPFLEFWMAYPKKVGKGAAFNAYRKIKSPRPTLKVILDSIAAHAKTDQWKTKTFIPNPATFLNQRRWEDEFSPDDFKPGRPQLSRNNPKPSPEYAVLS